MLPKQRTSWISKIKAKKDRMYDYRFIPHEGRPRYFFLKVSPPKERMFLKVIHGTVPFDVADFGEIVASGYGEPSDVLKQEMIEKYDLSYDD